MMLEFSQRRFQVSGFRFRLSGARQHEIVRDASLLAMQRSDQGAPDSAPQDRAQNQRAPAPGDVYVSMYVCSSYSSYVYMYACVYV